MSQLKEYLDRFAAKFNQPDFIPEDPVSIPHMFERKQDIEIMGFWTAILSWGQRVTILNKSRELINLMDDAPYQFVMQHQEKDLKRFMEFKHRTFQPTDTLYFIDFFKWYYQEHDSLETAFLTGLGRDDIHVENALRRFHQLFFSMDHAPERTRKHVSTPARNSSCKRLNMFLRWMVRRDEDGVDFGIWKRIKMSQLICPLDVHVGRVSRRMGLLTRRQNDWKAAVELTANLRKLDPGDPVKYDYALFGLGLTESAFGKKSS